MTTIHRLNQPQRLALMNYDQEQLEQGRHNKPLSSRRPNNTPTLKGHENMLHRMRIQKTITRIVLTDGQTFEGAMFNFDNRTMTIIVSGDTEDGDLLHCFSRDSIMYFVPLENIMEPEIND